MQKYLDNLLQKRLFRTTGKPTEQFKSYLCGGEKKVQTSLLQEVIIE